MKVILLISIFHLATVSGRSNPPDSFEQNRKLGRGVNIIGYDPIWRAKEQGRFQAKHFRLLKQAGFNSVRVNLHPFRDMNSTNGWAIRESWFEVLDWAVKNAREQGLMAILDLHEYNAMGEDPAANKQKFLAVWRQLSTRYQSAPQSVLFELLNEPNKNLTPALWNDYLKEALTIIRKENPTRTIIVGPGFWNSIDHLHELELPANDTNLIVTIHYYQPMDFTHQGAPWAGRKDKLGVAWLGNEKELGKISQDFDKASAWAKENNRPLFLGEFGAYDKGPMDSRARYTAAVARAAEQRGWSWAYWQFDSDFILYDIPRDAWVEPILRALIPNLSDLEGHSIDPFQSNDAKAIVFLFVRTDCPISNRYAPEMQRLRKKYPQMAFWLVYPDPDSTPEEIANHIRGFNLSGFRVIRDPRHALVKRAGVRVTPEAAVFAADGRELYRGRIDNRYVDVGKERPAPTQRDLDDTLKSILHGKAIASRATTAVGCYIPELP